MALNTLLSLDFNHQKGYKIPIKHKEAIRQLYWFGKVPVCALMVRYKLGDTTIRKILGYLNPERRRPRRTGPSFLLSNAKVDEIILYCAESWENRIIQWPKLREELSLKCSVETLERRLHAREYHRCIVCQKPFLTLAQVKARFLWAIAHLFWTVEWLKVLWSDEVTFLVGGKSTKERVTRNSQERQCLTCIQHQFYRGHTTAVNAWGAIKYSYKSPLIFIHGSSKSNALKQVDYLSQILELYIRPILEAFAAITHLLCPCVEPLFMEDGNLAHGYKSYTNCCQRFRTRYSIILMPHPGSLPDMNPIEKCWRRIKQAIHRRAHQPTTVAEMEVAVTEE